MSLTQLFFAFHGFSLVTFLFKIKIKVKGIRKNEKKKKVLKKWDSTGKNERPLEKTRGKSTLLFCLVRTVIVKSKSGHFNLFFPGTFHFCYTHFYYCYANFHPVVLKLKGKYCFGWLCVWPSLINVTYKRPIRKMAATNYHKFIFVKQTNEPHREKEHVNISDTAKFQSCRPNAGGMADIWKLWK